MRCSLAAIDISTCANGAFSAAIRSASSIKATAGAAPSPGSAASIASASNCSNVATNVSLVVPGGLDVRGA